MAVLKHIVKLSITELLLGALALLLGFLVFMTVIGNIFPVTVQAVGLDWLYIPLKGVYADCSKSENQSISFCRPKTERENRPETFSRPRGIPNRSKGNPLPFSLSDSD